MHAESPQATPVRLAGGQLETADGQFDHLFRSSFSHVQWVSNGFMTDDEDDLLALTPDDAQRNLVDQQAEQASILESLELPAGESELNNQDSDQAASAEEQTDDDEARLRRERTMTGIGALKKPATEIRIRTDPGGEVPDNRAELVSHHQSAISIGALGIASPPPTRYTICFKHRPLYYEQRNLERCGQSCGCLQNGFSAAAFLWNTAILPYQIGRQHCDCLVPAGGDCKTCQSYPCDCKLLPCDLHGLSVQAAALAGFTFLLL
jgi:hypothetical protein